MNLSRSQKVFLGTAVAVAVGAMLVGAGAWLKPAMAEVALSPSSFRQDTSGLLMKYRVSQSLTKWTARGFSLRIWRQGRPVTAVDAFSELDLPQPAYLIRDEAVLYANAPMFQLISQAPGEVVLRVDTRLAALGLAPPLVGAVVVLAGLGGLAFFAPLAGKKRGDSPHRLHALDSLRGLAALCVVIFHGSGTFFPLAWFQFYFRDGKLLPAPPVMEWIKRSPLELILTGKVMVAIFWILSGLVLSLPLLGESSYLRLGQAAVKRYFRLMPLAAVTTLVSYVLVASGAYCLRSFHAATDYGVSPYFVQAYAGPANPDLLLALEAALGLGNRYNAPLWTISLELWGSLLLFAVLGCTMALKRRRWFWGLCLVYLAGVAGQYSYADFFLGLFLADFLRARGHEAERTLKTLPAALILVLAVLMGSASPGWLSQAQEGASPIMEAFLTNASAWAFVSLACLSRPAIRFLTWKPLIWLGERSFAVYAVHVLLIYGVGRWASVGLIHLGVPVAPACALGMAVFLVATGAAAHWLYQHVDRPSMALANALGRWAAGARPLSTAREEVAWESKPEPSVRI